MYRTEFLMRDRLSVSKRPDPCFARTASTRQDFKSAFALIQKRYHASGLTGERDTNLRIMPYHLSSSSQVFVAEKAGKVIGTVTLVQESGDGLPMDADYPEAIGRLRQTSQKIGEITSLAVDPLQASQGEIFVKLTRLLTFFARAQGLQYLTAVVHPRHAKFYQHAMGCEVIGNEKSIASVGGSPGIALFGNINDPTRYRSRWRDEYFVNDFTTAELSSSSMCSRDCEYFFDLLNR